jgi:hypothetical protein
VPIEILYDRMKTAVIGEDAEGHVDRGRASVRVSRRHRAQAQLGG